MIGSVIWKGPTGTKQGNGKFAVKGCLVNHAHFCHNLDQAEWNDWGAPQRHRTLLLWEALKKIKCHKHVANNLAHHLHIAFSVSASLGSTSRAHIIQHGCSLTGSTVWVTQLLCDHGAELRRAWGQSSSNVREAKTQDTHMKPQLDDKRATQEQKLNWMLAKLV